MRNIQGRRAQIIAAAAVATMLLVGGAGCGGGSSDAGSDGGTKTTKADSSDSSSDSGSDTGSDDASGDLPDPCSLVTIEKASEILGGESAPADDMDSDASTGLLTCSWQTQASIDEPSLDGAGHVLTLTVLGPMGGMSGKELFETSKQTATDEAEVEGCDDAYWLGGQLSAIKGDVLLGGSAGLADDSPEAKQSATDLVAAACSSL